MSSSFLASAASSQLEGQLHQTNLCTVRRRHQQLQQQHKEVISGHPSSSPPYAYGSSASPNQRNSRVTSSSASNSSSLIGSSGDSNNINNNNYRDYNMISSRDGKNCNSTEDLRVSKLSVDFLLLVLCFLFSSGVPGESTLQLVREEIHCSETRRKRRKKEQKRLTGRLTTCLPPKK